MRFPAFHNRAPGHFPKEKVLLSPTEASFSALPAGSARQFHLRHAVPFPVLFSEDTLLLHGTDQENSSAAPQTRCPADPGRQFFHPADIDIAKQRFLLPAEGRQFDRSFSFHQRVYQVIFSLPRQMGNDNSFTQLLLLMLPAEPAFALLPFRCLRKLPRAESCMQTAAVQPRTICRTLPSRAPFRFVLSFA